MDEKRFSGLFIQNRRRLFGLAYWLTRSADESEDLVQDVYCYTRRRLHTMPDTEHSFICWVFKGMRILRQTRMRSRSREYDAYRRLSAQAQQIFSEGKAEHDESLRPYRLMVFDAVRKLPRMYRVPIVLHEMMGYRCEEISAMENVGTGTVQSRLYRGRRILKKQLRGLACEENFRGSGRKRIPKRDSASLRAS